MSIKSVPECIGEVVLQAWNCREAEGALRGYAAAVAGPAGAPPANPRCRSHGR